MTFTDSATNTASSRKVEAAPDDGEALENNPASVERAAEDHLRNQFLSDPQTKKGDKLTVGDKTFPPASSLTLDSAGKMGSGERSDKQFPPARKAVEDKKDSKQEGIDFSKNDPLKKQEEKLSKEDEEFGKVKEEFDKLRKELEQSAESEENEEEKEGVEELPTGDYIVREDGKESLFTPNGDRITLNPDGTHTIKGNVKKVSSDKDGTTTVEFKDGAQVSFDNDGFLSVQRGNQGVGFGRKGSSGEIEYGKGGGKGSGRIAPDLPSESEQQKSTGLETPYSITPKFPVPAPNSADQRTTVKEILRSKQR